MTRESRHQRREVIKALGASAATIGITGYTRRVDGDNSAYADIDPDNWANQEGEEILLLTQEGSDVFRQYWSTLSDRFNAATGATINFEFTGRGLSIRERITQLVQSGNPPDIAMLGMETAATMFLEGALADHTEVVESWEDQWDEDVPDRFRIFDEDGRDQWLPMWGSPMMNWYRADVFDEPPTTWELELSQAEEHDEGAGGTRGAMVPLGDGVLSNWDVYSYGFGNGARSVEWDGDSLQVVIDDDDNLGKWIEVFDHLEQLFQFSADNLDVTAGQRIEALPGEFAYQVPFPGARPKFASENVDFGASVRPTRFATPDGDGTVGGGFQGHGMFADSNTDVATEFLKFWALPENNMGFYIADPIHNGPLLESVRQHETYQDMIDNLPDHWQIPDDLTWEYFGDDWAGGMDYSMEVSPPNPFAGRILGSSEFHNMKRDILVEGRDKEEAIVDRAQNIQDIIDQG